MKPEKILPAWRCPEHKGNVYTEPGRCTKCGLRLQRFTPLSDLPHVFRCRTCRGVFAEEPPDKDGHLWICPTCQTPTITAWGCDESYVEKLKDRQGIRSAQAPAPPVKKGSTYRFGRTVKAVFEATNSVSKAAFRAQQLAERLSHRRPKDSDDQGYIDAVEFDISRFNIRAQMVVDMLMVRSLLEESGLGSYVDGALNRILDARLGPRVERQIRSPGKTKE
jgi:hypothetical protein